MTTATVIIVVLVILALAAAIFLDTEDLRQAFVHYRDLFVELVKNGSDADSGAPLPASDFDHTAQHLRGGV